MELAELKQLLKQREHEHLEFKTEKSPSILGDGGKKEKSILGYCVALGNEGGGKLIYGVSDKIPRKIIGTSALENFPDIKSKIYKNLGKRIDMEEIFDEKRARVVVITIPSRPIAQTFKFYNIPLMRVGEELKKMDDFRQTEILNENRPDWSAEICHQATLEDLDPKALSIARENYKKKNPRIVKEIDKWSDKIFLNKTKLAIKGEITNTTIILLGKKESSPLISPAVAQITWILKAEDGSEKDYEHFSCPLLLSVNKVHKRIRNLKYRYIKDKSLFPEEINMYEPYVIREALHNCIAHQDYSLHSRIQVIENEEGYLLFTNKGRFLPGSIEAVIQTDAPQEYYKNRFLVEAMVNLNMIDTIGSGIKKMFNFQKERFFPLPSYDFPDNKVSVKIHGKVLDLDYARALAQHKDLTLVEIMLLDQIQKKRIISKENAKQLREKNLIEGRYPNIHISKNIAETAGKKAQYIKNKGLDDIYYKNFITDYLEKYPNASRKDIDDFLIDKLPEILSKKQRAKKVANLLSALSKKEGKIINKGNNRKPKWNIKNN